MSQMTPILPPVVDNGILANQNFCEKLRHKCANDDIAYRDIGRAIGRNKNMISNFVYGTSTPSIIDAVRIAEYLEISIFEMMGVEENG